MLRDHLRGRGRSAAAPPPRRPARRRRGGPATISVRRPMGRGMDGRAPVLIRRTTPGISSGSAHEQQVRRDRRHQEPEEARRCRPTPRDEPLKSRNAPNQPESRPPTGIDRRATAIAPANGSHWSTRMLQNTSRRLAEVVADVVPVDVDVLVVARGPSRESGPSATTRLLRRERGQVSRSRGISRGRARARPERAAAYRGSSAPAASRRAAKRPARRGRGGSTA